MENTLFGITKEQAKEIFDIALSTGGEFAEVFMEDTMSDNLDMLSGKLSKSTVVKKNGAALRIIKGETEVNSSLTHFDFKELCEQARKLSLSFDGEVIATCQEFKTPVVEPVTHIKRLRSKNNVEEIELLTRASKAMQAVSEEIVQVRAVLSRTYQKKAIFASDGTWVSDERCNLRLSALAVASDGKNMQTGSSSFGRSSGLEMFDGFDVETFAKNAAQDAVAMLHAEDMPGGEIPVVINNGFGGVILHEACVHGLEATSVAKGLSVFCNKIGEKIASDIVNAVDTGRDEDAWGSFNVDDEGTPSKRNVLIENGILKSYLVDKKNAKRMNHPITGSSRRQSYRYQTTSRMSNTYFLTGTSTFDEIIKNTKYGLFAKEMGGGSVNPGTGEFNFAVNVGYLIEDGKITRPVRGATLVGSGKDVLKRIDMIANNLAFGHGMCGSSSGSVPTNVGQPTIRVSSMTVGGKGGNK